MAKSLTLANVIDKNKIASTTAWVFALSIDVTDPTTGLFVETIRVCRNNEALTIDGDLYDAFPFGVGIEESAGELPTVTIALTDVTQQVQALAQKYEGGLGFPVTLMIVPVFDADLDQDLEPDLVEDFVVVTASSDSSTYTTTWGLGAENPLSIKIPRRTQSRDRCSFDYKSVECGYGGIEATCSRTINGSNGCKSKSHEKNYGGLPGILSR